MLFYLKSNGEIYLFWKNMIPTHSKKNSCSLESKVREKIASAPYILVNKCYVYFFGGDDTL